MCQKNQENYFENNKQRYIELAEQRAIKKLGLTERQVIYAKAFETTKACELIDIEHEVCGNYPQKKEKKPYTWIDTLFSRF